MKNKIENSGIVQLLKIVWLENVPSYANKFFYSLGFLSMISFFLLIISGVILVFFGPDWWFTTSMGTFIRSIHLWATQAFVIFIILHLLIVFFSGGYRPPRRFVWVLGALMFFLVLFNAEFGYVLRNDFSSQWRSLQGADLYNGSGIGRFINNLNYAQVYGIHIIIIPIIILGILFLHYALVRLRGIATPYKKNFEYRIVKANHFVLFFRGFILVCVIVLLAIIFPSPLIAPVTIKQVAIEDPRLMAQTLLSELDYSSDTATYFDTIDPYTFNTKNVYIATPYIEYFKTQQGTVNLFDSFNQENKQLQNKNINLAKNYFSNNGKIIPNLDNNNPVIPMISSLVLMAKSGLYEASLRNEINTGYNPTYVLRFLSDTGVLEDKATKLGITTQQYGMLREEKGQFPPGAWWLAPLGFMDNTILKNDVNQDQHGAEILGILMLVFIAFPYIPILNELPDKLKIYKLIWRDKHIIM